MSKPNWKDAPEWANYVALDSDGLWFWYEDEPEKTAAMWFNRKGTRQEMVTESFVWSDSLERRP